MATIQPLNRVITEPVQGREPSARGPVPQAVGEYLGHCETPVQSGASLKPHRSSAVLHPSGKSRDRPQSFGLEGRNSAGNQERRGRPKRAANQAEPPKAAPHESLTSTGEVSVHHNKVMRGRAPSRAAHDQAHAVSVRVASTLAALERPLPPPRGDEPQSSGAQASFSAASGSQPVKKRATRSGPGRVCRVCGARDHATHNCPDSEARKAIAVTGMPVAAALAIIDPPLPEGAGDAAAFGGEAGSIPDSPADAEEKKREEDEARAALQLANLKGNMLAKAKYGCADIGKDLSNAADRATIARSVVAIARAEKFHEQEENSVEWVLDEVDNARRWAVQRRYHAAIASSCGFEVAASYPETLRHLLFPDHSARPWLDDFAFRSVRGWAVEPIPHFEQAHTLERMPLQSVEGKRYHARAHHHARVFRFILALLWPAVEDKLKQLCVRAAARYVSGHLDKFGAPRWLTALAGRLQSVLVAIAIAAWESRGKSWSELALRAFAHSVLPTLQHGTRLHTLWNVVQFLVGRKDYMLSVAEPNFKRRYEGKHASESASTRNISSLHRTHNDVCLAEHGLPIVPVQEAFKVTWTPDKVCHPKLAIIEHYSVDGFEPTIPRLCTCNEMIGICGRVGKRLPIDNDPEGIAKAQHVWELAVQTVGLHVLKLVAPVRRGLPLAGWLGTQPPAKRQMYERLMRDGLEREPNVASSFLKKEITMKEASLLKFSDPRVIQGCPPTLTLATGRFVRRAAKNLRQGLRPRVDDDWLRGKQIVYTCGLDNSQIGNEFAKALRSIEGALDVGEKLVILEDDQSRFDLHLKKQAFGALDAMYRKLLPPHVATALRRGISKGRTCLGTRYTVPYTMQSGWPDTSYGDSLANTLMKYAVHGVGRKWISIICGDDSVTVTSDREIRRLGGEAGITASYSKFGMEVKVVLATNPLDTGFCSGRFMPCGESYVLVPKTGKMIAKSGCDMECRTGAASDAWMRGVAQGLLSFGRADPLLGSLGRGLLSGLGDGKSYQHQDLQRKLANVTCVVVPPGDYLTYYDHHYGMSLGDFDKLSVFLAGVREGDVITHPLIRHMISVDLE